MPVGCACILDPTPDHILVNVFAWMCVCACKVPRPIAFVMTHSMQEAVFVPCLVPFYPPLPVEKDPLLQLVARTHAYAGQTLLVGCLLLTLQISYTKPVAGALHWICCRRGAMPSRPHAPAYLV